MRKVNGFALLLAIFWLPVQAMQVIMPGNVTHRSVADGDWQDASTWDNGLPDASAVVQISPGTRVTVSGGDIRVADIRVDGTLRFSAQAHTVLRLDTLEVMMAGVLEAGSPAQPIADGSLRIVFDSDSDIDTQRDPDLLGRGLLAHGRVQLHGQPKTVHLKLALDARAGDDTLTLAEAPLNWQPGDTLVLTGTRYSGWKWDNSIQSVRYHESQDEVRQIVAVDGALVTLDQALEFDHLSPRADLKASVANFSRSVTLETDAAQTAPIHRRGHVMLMNSTDFDIRYVALHQLGRTDKSVPSFDLDQLAQVGPDSNVRGRYPLHFHITGIDQASQPATAIGNAVFGSPGWGFVHHASNAMFANNASYDTHGAGYVAETGDEIGAWVDNIAIRAKGNSAFNPKNGVDTQSFDMARTGTGFWFQGRMVRSVGNIAASVNQGFVYLHRGTRMRDFPGSVFSMPEALRRDREVSPDDAPILNFHRNEAFAATVGLYVVKANPNQQHDIHSHLSDFLAWEVRAGAALEYTSHYLLENFEVIGKTSEPFSNAAFGIEFGNNTSDMVIRQARVEGFPVGIRLGKNFTAATPPEANQYVVIDPSFVLVSQHYDELDTAIDLIIDSSDLQPERMSIELNGGQLLEYLSPATTAGSGLDFLGFKLDSIGLTPIPAGTDAIGVPSYEMIAICEQDGYFRSSDGSPWVIVEEYFTDRASGRIHKFGIPVRLGPDVDALLGNPFHAWRDAFERGPIDLAKAAPEAFDDLAAAVSGGAVLVDVLANDVDPLAASLEVDGLIQPHHGLVTLEADGRLRYQPDPGFTGDDSFRYWASDRQGNFSPATVRVRVSDERVFADGFEGMVMPR